MNCPALPPKPPARPDRVGLLAYLRLFRADILSAQPARLYRAWMAEFRAPFLRSFLCNDPALVDLVLRRRAAAFPKSARLSAGLAPLLGRSVFLTNGAEWARQRRIIDPAFEGGRMAESFPALREAGAAMVARLAPRADGRALEIEAETSHAAADAIFRTLFSLPIEDAAAAAVFAEFRAHQEAQPLLNPASLLPLPRWLPRLHGPAVRRTARGLRARIAALVAARTAQIAAGRAPQDLATRIMTTPDPETGTCFSPAEMVDQVAIFFLAGHETSASALAWALHLLATHPEWQARAAAEASAAVAGGLDIAAVGRLRVIRAVFREALRLYPPVPMYLREATQAECFRGRPVARGDQIVISPWHLHRHERLWAAPDAFDPGRWDTPEGRAAARRAFVPFSAGPRVCPGAGFAMVEGPLFLAQILAAYDLSPVPGRVPVPVAHLTVRGRGGIWLSLRPRSSDTI